MKTGLNGGIFDLWFRTAVDTVRFPKGHEYFFSKPTPNAAGM